MTVRDLIYGSMRLIGVLGEGEAPSAQALTDAFNALNDMLDSWSTESLVVYDRPREEFSLTSGKQAYTIGTGGDFNTSRPQFIERALYKDTSVTPAYEIPMDVLTMRQWEEISVKGVQGTIPFKLWYDNAFPLMTINLWPVPGAGRTLVLYSWKPLADFANSNATLSLPPGYNRALRYNLAIELAPEYGKSASPEVAKIASEAKANLERMNTKQELMTVDAGLIGKGQPFNWYTGE